MNIILLIAFLAIGGIRAIHLSRLVDEESSAIKGAEFFVSIKLKGRHRCGGALITSNIVITIAECVVDPDYKRYKELSIMVAASLNNGDNREIPIKRLLFPARSKTRSGRRCRAIAALILSDKIKLFEDYSTILVPRNSIRDVQRKMRGNPIVATLITLRGEKIDAVHLYLIEQLQIRVNLPESISPFMADYVPIFFFGTSSNNYSSHTDVGSPLVYDDRLIGIMWRPTLRRPHYLDVYEHLEFIRSAMYKPKKLYIVS